ncbi:MAG: hypothetical protein A3E07_02405 [Candidatus Wildermuthbacteria bacterium RIFCSPHIGHO2_12_FULL_45_9]|nr:MAG: hypothetical protein A3E07_02405 [Candidatus Wildermuthbacteria bacterium RIFCSPHIGHO2_12_FULL_45_9]
MEYNGISKLSPLSSHENAAEVLRERANKWLVGKGNGKCVFIKSNSSGLEISDGVSKLAFCGIIPDMKLIHGPNHKEKANETRSRGPQKISAKPPQLMGRKHEQDIQEREKSKKRNEQDNGEF